MYPEDNIFNIYYTHGRRLPMIVKRCQPGSRGYFDEDYRNSHMGQTFLILKVIARGKYGSAYGHCFFNGENNDNNYSRMPIVDGLVEIPNAGCGGWNLVEIIDQKKSDANGDKEVENEKTHDVKQESELITVDSRIRFGKYKGDTYREIYEKDPSYIGWVLRKTDVSQYDLYSFSRLIEKE